MRGAKPGLFQPACPGCGGKYVLAIPAERAGKALVAKSLEHLRAYHAKAKGASQVLEAIQDEPVSVAVAARPVAATVAAAAAVDATSLSLAAGTLAPPPASLPPRPRPIRPAPDPTATALSIAPAAHAPAASRPLPTPQPTPTPASLAETAMQADASHDGRLGGYALIKLLGRGGMGEVYLARQLSLDRNVAVKTIHPRWASGAVFVSRFTREAFAAAQLVHHNVVQIHDIGEDSGTHFFSMEYVAGRSLADLLREHGRLDPEVAAGYVLQAARGLKYAHDHGMVHRDVKPHNLLLSEDDGVVKLVDLGLVKRQDSAEHTRVPGAAGHTSHDLAATSADASMGSPAYMAPEQAKDPTAVDARADVYALGVSFYQLVTGQLPYQAQTAPEMAQLHARGGAPAADAVNPRVPKPLAAVIARMMATDPKQRYPHLGEVIAALERFLNITAGPFTPQEEHARVLEEAVRQFNASGPARLRKLAIVAFFAACGAAAALALVADRPTIFGSAVAMLLATLVCYGSIVGFLRGPYLFKKLRQFVFGSNVTDWLTWLAITALLVAAIVFTGQAVLYAGVLVAAAAVAVLFAVVADRVVARDRAPHAQAVHDMLKGMRLRGLEEDALRRFVCKYSGERWEPFYEALFGYEAKLFAREHWGRSDNGRARKRYGVWRDGVVRWVDARQQMREEARQRKHLQRIEERRLRAEGKTEAEAKRHAAKVADEILDHVSDYSPHGRGEGKAAVVAHVLGRPTAATGDDAADMPESWQIQRPSPRGSAWNLVLGNKGRLLAGAALLLIAAWWMRQRQLGLPDFEGRGSIWRTLREFVRQDAPPIDLPLLPRLVEDVLCSQGAAVAGALLLASSIFRGTRQTWLLVPALGVLLAGPRFLPAFGAISPQLVAITIGLALGAAALWLGRKS